MPKSVNAPPQTTDVMSVPSDPRGWQPHAPYDAMAPHTGRVVTPTMQQAFLTPMLQEAPAPPPPPTNNHLAAQREARLLEQIQSGFKSITPTLIMTGIAIGFASAIGSALGAILVNHYITKHRRSSSSRR